MTDEKERAQTKGYEHARPPKSGLRSAEVRSQDGGHAGRGRYRRLGFGQRYAFLEVDLGR